ncbi:MAG: hypothetical protein GJ680_05035 [Alteromonadaceae bacterium]|nr:hypothetical protein [Alteromonadaceae bacterium]
MLVTHTATRRPWLHHLWCYLFYLTLFTPSLVSATDTTTSEETVSITVLDGTTGKNNPLVGKRVSLHIVEGDRLAWVSNLTSNPNGNVSAVLEGVTSGAQYAVKVQHPITGKWITSDLITSTEAFTFVVGTLPLNITLLNPVTNAPVTATRVDAHRYRDDGSRYREARQTTDDNGQVTFHLTEITDTTPVELHLRTPEGYFAKATLTSTGEHNVVFGNTQITVRNGRIDGNPLMTGTRLRVYHARADKNQSVFNRDIGATGSVLVDLPALQNGESYYAEVTIEGDKYRHDFTATGAHDFTFGNINEDLIVTLLDGTGAAPVPMTDKRVAVHRVDPDKLRWISNKNTDETGVAKVALRGLTEGQQFVLKAQHPISGKWFQSSPISNNENFTFTVGSSPLVVTLKNPVTGAPVTNTRVDALRYREDGSRYREARQTTDDNGQVTFHLTEISDSQPVELHLKTPEGYFAKASLTSTGNHDVVFGDTQIIVRNGRIDGSPLMTGTRLRVYHARADKNQNVFNRDIGASGSVLMDLPDLQNGESYYAEVTIEGDKYRQDFTSAGAHDFTFGNVGEDLIVTLLDGTGADPVPMTDKRIAVYRVDPDKLRWISNKNTDETGVAKVALRGLSEGQQFVLKAQHPISGKWFQSSPISNNENFTFTVGSSPLVVTLKNPVTGAPVTNTRVDALRYREDGSRYREARQTTDDNGQVTFHLTEISDEKLVELHLTTPEGYFAKSTLTSTGSHDVSFGDTQITVRNGRIDGSPLMTGSRLRVYHARADKNKNVFNRDIGESGSVLMDLPDLQDGESYYAEVTIEGDKSRLDFTSAGSHDFTFGDIGEDLTVTLLDGTGAEPVPMVDKRISVHRVDPDKLRWISNKDTDESGVAKVALRGLSEGQQFVLKAQHPISGKWFESDVITNNSDFDFVVGITPMVVTLVNPVTEAAIVDARIDVKRQREDGSWYREDRGNTDENGQDTFHLTEVSASQPALLQAWSPDGFYAEMMVTTSGAIEFPMGDTQITLRNGRAEGNPIITGERVRIYHVTETERKRIFNRDLSDNGTVLLQLPETASAQDVFDVEVEVEDDKYTRQFSGTGGHDLVFGDLNEDVLVTLLDGTQAQPTPITDWRIAVHRVDEDKLRWVSNKNTDDSGVAKLALSGLSEGKQFVLKAQHTITGKWFSSEMIGNNSDFTFIVGAPALVINLFHPRTGLPMPNTRMDIHRQREDDSWYREARDETDENGQATFYLQAISETDPIEIRTVSADGFWASTEITSTGTIDLPFGNVPVQVIDKETGVPIVGKRLEALWMDADNKLTREARYNTNADGEVLFELDRLVENVRYALKLKNPFGENKTYYGPIVYGEGAIEFLVKKANRLSLI